MTSEAITGSRCSEKNPFKMISYIKFLSLFICLFCIALANPTQIGEGTFANVYPDPKDPKFAIKVYMKLDGSLAKSMNDLVKMRITESETMKAALQADPLVSGIQIMEYTVGGKKYPALRIPRYGGETLDKLINRGGLTEDMVKSIKKQIYAIDQKFKANGVLLLDRHTKNYMYDPRSNKLNAIDFGIAYFSKEFERKDPQRLREIVSEITKQLRGVEKELDGSLECLYAYETPPDSPVPGSTSPSSSRQRSESPTTSKCRDRSRERSPANPQAAADRAKSPTGGTRRSRWDTLATGVSAASKLSSQGPRRKRWDT